MIGAAPRRMYDAEEVDAYTGPLEAQIAALGARLASIRPEVTPLAADEPAAALERRLDHAHQLARRDADETIRAAQREASAVLARANREAHNRVADAQVKAAFLVSAVRGRIDSLAVAWEHQLLKQIKETRHDVLSGLDRVAEQLRISPDHWNGPEPPGQPNYGPVAEPWAIAGHAEIYERPATPESYVLVAGPRPDGRPADGEVSAEPAAEPGSGARARRRRGLGVMLSWRFGLTRSRRRRAERITSGDDPFFNPDLRWKDDCGDEEFMSFLRFGDTASLSDRISRPPGSDVRVSGRGTSEEARTGISY